jgi:MFS family permease
MKVPLFYLLALAGGFVAGWVYSFLFGAVYSVLPTGAFQRWRHHNKLYLHWLWISRQFVTTLVAFWVFTYFGLVISWPFIFLLCAPPAFILFSKQLPRPENLGYFNLFLPNEAKLTDTDRYIVLTNRLEGVSRIAGLFVALYVARLTSIPARWLS